MAPRKAQANGTGHENSAIGSLDPPTKTSKQDIDLKKGESKGSKGTKRKKESQTSDAPSKAPRRSVRSEPTTLSKHEQIKLLNFLLSRESLAYTRPTDEVKDVEARGGDSKVRTYALSEFSPLEELISAMILSRPIGHALGVRSMRTLFNPPHNLTTFREIQKAGYEGVRAALDEARTQHRQKTAEQIVGLADFFTESGEFKNMGDSDTSLEEVRKSCDHDAEKERQKLQHIKGLAKTGLDIFGRRIQGLWGEWYPFGDERTLGALAKLGLPGDAVALKELVEGEWKSLDVPEEITGQSEERQRKVFVRILERAIGSELEGNLEDMKKAALD